MGITRSKPEEVVKNRRQVEAGTDPYIYKEPTIRKVSIAVAQMACSTDRTDNILHAGELVREAAAKGAQVVLLQELFETPYFCIEKSDAHFAEARSTRDNPAIKAMQELAAELDVVIPVSFYELGEDGKYYNSLAMVDAGGDLMGVYRKSHIPDFPAYEEAFYFEPGDTGFMVWDTKYLKIGCGICWDQWFPEAARAMALMGAELLMYPTAIGNTVDISGSDDAEIDPWFEAKHAFSAEHWQRTQQGHAAANQVILAAANRVGFESGGGFKTMFYGHSFIANGAGRKIVNMDECSTGVALATFNLEDEARFRKEWGIFRTRRPDLYDPLLSQPAPAALMKR